MTTSIAGFILRAGAREETARFYAELGLSTNEHQHGGPVHYEVRPLDSACVLEIYAHSQAFPRDALMINVDSIDVALRVAAMFGIRATTDIKESGDVKFIYIVDPDDRSVMLIEKK